MGPCISAIRSLDLVLEPEPAAFGSYNCLEVFIYLSLFMLARLTLVLRWIGSQYEPNQGRCVTPEREREREGGRERERERERSSLVLSTKDRYHVDKMEKNYWDKKRHPLERRLGHCINRLFPWPKAPRRWVQSFKNRMPSSGQSPGCRPEQVKSSCQKYPGGRFKAVYKGSIQADSSLEVGSET